MRLPLDVHGGAKPEAGHLHTRRRPALRHSGAVVAVGLQSRRLYELGIQYIEGVPVFKRLLRSSPHPREDEDLD